MANDSKTRRREVPRTFVPLLTVYALSGIFSLHAGAQAPDPWPTHAFEVRLGSGSLTDSILSALFSRGLEREALAEQIAAMESYFAEAAARLDEQHFRAPPMARGDRGYLVNLFDYDDQLAPARAEFDGTTCALNIDLSRAFVDGRMEDRLLEHAGHELFHCVQNAYPLFAQNWELGDWIAEATAQALGQDLLWQLRGVEYPRRNAPQRWGGRAYYRRLALSDGELAREGLPDNFHYYTESFWRYLGEYAAAKRRGGRAGVAETPADYSYLDALFRRQISGGGEAAELTWADQGLEAVLGFGLDRAYADFVSTFAAYVPERAVLSAGATPEDARDSWMKFLFEQCEVRDPTAPLSRVELDLEPFAARCVTLSSSVQDQVTVDVHVRSDSVEVLRSLVLGKADGTIVRQPDIVPSPVSGGWMAHWRLRLGLDPSSTLIVVNAHEDAASTRRQSVTLELDANGFATSVTRPTPEAAPAPASASQNDPALAAAADRVATGLAALSANSGSSVSVSHDRDEPSCAEPFRFEPCGPNTTINLSLAPGAVGAFDAAAGTGGDLGQFLTTLAGVAANGIAETDAGLAAAAQAIASEKGSTVHITMPAIDYGFTGSVSNVYIRVNGEGGDDLESIGPRDVIPGPGRGFPLAGRVTIEEYSPFVLRGSFAAAFVNTSRVGDDLGDDPSFAISDNIEGLFSIGAPWQNDSRVTRVQTESPFELAAQDLAEFMPAVGAAAAAQARASASGAAQGGSALGFSVAPMTAFPSCNCDCAPIEQLPTACRSVCEPAVLHCAAIERFAATDLGLASRAAEVSAAAVGLRERFAEFMTSQNFDPALQGALIDAFDQQATALDQRNFVVGFGMRVEPEPEVQGASRQTREEYRAELIATGVRPELHEELLAIFDELERRRESE